VITRTRPDTFSGRGGVTPHRPFATNPRDASEKELAEVAGLFDVANDGFDDHFARRVDGNAAFCPQRARQRPVRVAVFAALADTLL
jgi:hypothetical protein